MLFGRRIVVNFADLGKVKQIAFMGKGKIQPQQRHLQTASSHAMNDSKGQTGKKEKFTVCVEGNIASGKTSFLQYFQNRENVEVFEEPVKKWRDINGHNALAKMYEDPTRWSLTLQTYVQLTMLEQHLKETVYLTLHDIMDKVVKLMERSIYSAKYCFVENLHNSGKMPPLEYTVLTEWYNWIIKNENCKVDLIVYLQTKPETVFQRIKDRKRKEEQTIPLEYLQTLHELHEDWLIKETKFKAPSKVLVIPADMEMKDMHEVYENKKEEILCGII